MLFTGSGGIQIDRPKTRNGLPWPLERHRQKSETEGQTFTKKIGERVLPEFVSGTAIRPGNALAAPTWRVTTGSTTRVCGPAP